MRVFLCRLLIASAFFFGPGVAAASHCDGGLVLTTGTATYRIKTMIIEAVSSSFSIRSTLNGDQIQETTADESGSPIPAIWICSNMGIRMKNPIGGADLSVRGSFLPGIAQLKVGYSWKSSYALNPKGTMPSTTDSKSTVLGTEKVITQTGTFTAWKIQVLRVTKFIPQAGIELPADGLIQKSEYYAWYTPDIGLIRSVDKDGTFDIVLTNLVR